MAVSAELQMKIVRSLDEATTRLDRCKMLCYEGFHTETRVTAITQLVIYEQWHDSLMLIADAAGVPTNTYKRK